LYSIQFAGGVFTGFDCLFCTSVYSFLQPLNFFSFSFLAFAPLFSHYTCLAGVFGVETVSDLLGGVLSGRVKTQVVVATF